MSYGTGIGDGGVDFGDLHDFEGNALNRSYNSAVTNSTMNNASASSSKAVLAALRALQDKIRRLEAERAQALDESAQLRHQIKNQEIETEHLRQRESLAAQKSLHEVRSAYEKILTEKTETEMRVAKLEERNRDEQRIAEELREKIRNLEDEKHSILLSVKDLEAEKSHLQNQIQHIQQKEKELGHTILWETKRHEEDMDILSSKLRSLQGEMSPVMNEKGVVETKLLELDQLVGQLLSVNESLVARLAGKPVGKAGAKKKSSLKPSSSLPRAASLSTVSFDHSRRAGLGPAAVAARVADEAESLQRMHKMYVDLANKITNPPKSKRPASAPVSRPPVSVNSRPSTMMKTKMSEENNGYFGESYGGPRTPSVGFGGAYGDDDAYLRTSQSYLNASSGSAMRSPSPAGDMHSVIASLEEEFASLNEQYRRLLSTVQAQSPSVDTAQAEQLVEVIQKLHKKGEQLRALKSSPPKR